jgi:exopolyphosphatase/guanosine-5'-triphosphate,3'-diphosphate pyrophosphatase
MTRYAAIDVGTNSVLLLVAERHSQNHWNSVYEQAEITRLGKGVDQTRRLSQASMDATLEVLVAYAEKARNLGVTGIVASATSAARDAQNGEEFLAETQRRTGLTLEIISGDEEARLSFSSAHADFGSSQPLIVVDIGGGSTEFIYGDVKGNVTFRESFNIGSVRLTERHGVHSEPMLEDIRRVFQKLPVRLPQAQVIGVAGTVTTVFAVARAIDPYDGVKVHGGTLSTTEVSDVLDRLWHLDLEQRRQLPGLSPKRADVIPAGALILHQALVTLEAASVRVSDRGLRWGLLMNRFGDQS